MKLFEGYVGLSDLYIGALEYLLAQSIMYKVSGEKGEVPLHLCAHYMQTHTHTHIQTQTHI